MSFEIKQEGKFEYLEKGEGDVIVLLHGLFGALSNFEALIDYFSKQYKVVVPLLPIYTLPVLNTNVKAIAKFLHTFIKYKQFDQVNLLGNSLGGHVALVYAVNHPEKIKSLILTGSSGLYENAFGSSFPRREDYEFIRKKVAVTFYDPKFATPELVDECYKIVNDKSRLIRILAIAKSAIRDNMAKKLVKLKMKVCLIWGKNDTITPPEVAEEFHKLLEFSDLYWIDKCGHAPMMEQSDEFIAILDNWLNTKLYTKA
jgi:pimeloyl-ACP methyl ester carboxylesterase